MKHFCRWNGRGWCDWCGAPKPLSARELVELGGLLWDDFRGSEKRFWGLVRRYNKSQKTPKRV